MGQKGIFEGGKEGGAYAREVGVVEGWRDGERVGHVANRKKKYKKIKKGEKWEARLRLGERK